MGNAHSSDDSGTNFTVANNTEDTTELNIDSVTDQAKEQQNIANQLLGADQGDGKINWLGSSFSGVDIKVVAHLYGSLELDQQLEGLRIRQQTEKRISDACRTLAENVGLLEQAVLTTPSGLSPELVSARVLGMAGLKNQNDASDQVAATFIIGVYNNTPRGPQFYSYLGQRLSDFATQHALLAQSMQDNISDKDQIRKKSSSTITLATLQTLSLQTHREKFAVRGLGSSYVKGYTRGPRTIAGSMIFTMFSEHALAQLIRSMSGKASIYGEQDTELSTLIADQLPPIDLTIVIANEYGQLSRLGIYGVEFVNDGITMSVEDIMTEEVMQFVARDCDVLTSMGNVPLSKAQRRMHFKDDVAPTSGTNLLFTSGEAYNAYLDKLKVRRRLINR